MAEEDDVSAFVLQCELNKLNEPFSFQRASNREEYLQQLRDFSPTLVIASYKLVGPPLIAETRQRAPGARVIVVGADGDAKAAEQAIECGATDCLFTSRLSEIRLCLEQEPHLRFGKDSHRLAGKKKSGAGRFIESSKEWFREAWRETCQGWEVVKTSSPGKVIRKAGAAFAHSIEETKNRFKLRLVHGKAFLTGAQALLAARAHRHFLPAGPHSHLMAAGFSTANPGQTGSPRATAGEPVDFILPGTRPDAEGKAVQSSPEQKVDQGESSVGGGWSPRSSGTEALASLQLQSLQRELYDEMAAREEAEEALQASELSFKTLFESSLDAVLLLDSEGAVLQANSAATALLGLPLAQLVQLRFSQFIEPDKKILFDSEWGGFLEQGFWRGEKTLKLSDGSSREVQFCVKANFWCGVHLFIARDVTDARRLSEELQEIRKALAKSLEAQAIQRRMLNELEQKLSWFAASAAKLGSSRHEGEAFV